MIRTLEGRVGPRDRDRTPILELPFEVPPGTAALHVRYRHDPGSILDLGLLDPTVEPFPSTRGLRGWSGGARSEVTVARGWATPGYLPGPIHPGTWRVLLGLASVDEGGCSYRVEVAAYREEADAPLRPDRGRGRPTEAGSPSRGAGAPADATAGGTAVAPLGASGGPSGRTGAGWYRGDLQSHTHHSDAKGTLLDLVAAARARGLEFLAVTDHNTTSHHAEIAGLSTPDLLLVPGTEVTTHHGHANVWGGLGPVDFRVRGPADVDVLIDHVRARGGVVSVNHPKASPGCIGCDWEYPVPARIDCLEAWQGPWPFRNWESLERYDRLLRAGRRVTLVGGSDRHQPAGPDTDPDALRVGSPTTSLELEERTVDGVLGALRAGRAAVAEGPDGPHLDIDVGGVGMGGTIAPTASLTARARLRSAAGELLRWVAADGVVHEVVVDDDPFEHVIALGRLAADATSLGFLRAEVTARAGLRPRLEALRRHAETRGLPAGIRPEDVEAVPFRMALSNPVYLRAHTSR